LSPQALQKSISWLYPKFKREETKLPSFLKKRCAELAEVKLNSTTRFREAPSPKFYKGEASA